MDTSAQTSTTVTVRNVLVLLDLTESQRERLEAAAPHARFSYSTRTGTPAELLAEADVIVGNPLPAPRLAEAENLVFFQLNSAGYDPYVKPGVLPGGARMASAVGAYGQAVSEHMLAMLLGLMKRLPAYRDDQHARTWTDEGAVTTLAGAHVLVLGAGDIGSHFAKLARALGAHVTGVRRRAGAPTSDFEAMAALKDLPEILGDFDVVASFLPSSEETRGLADGAFFSAMREGAFFVNGGRGDLVDQKALVDALASGKLAGAALDVTTPEPLPADDPLWDAPNLFITPHVSGGFHLPVVLENITTIAAENIRALQAGEPIRNLVQA